MINIFVIVIVFIFLVCGYHSGKFFSGYFGITGWITGFLTGFSLAIVIYYWVMRLLSKRDQINRHKKQTKKLDK